MRFKKLFGQVRISSGVGGREGLNKAVMRHVHVSYSLP